MLDFDYVCRRAEPSVVASTYPFTGDNKQKYYFGQKVRALFIASFSGNITSSRNSSIFEN